MNAIDQRYVQVYTPALAARLLQMHHSRVRRWLGSSPSAKRPVLVRGQTGGLASFLDLVELLMIRDLVSRDGWTVGRLRGAVKEASAWLSIDHPLARRQLYADGRELMIRHEGKVLTLLRGGQLALEAILEARMHVLEFDEFDVALRWWPEGRAGGVVLDPCIGFGAPTVPGTGIDTEVLFRLWRAEDESIERVAWAYGLEHDQVLKAVQWHAQHVATEHEKA